jgi:cytochrome c2
MKLQLLAILSTVFISSSYAWEAEKEWKTNCSTCHSIGMGDKIGPDLGGISKRRKMDWIVKFMQYPDGMIQGDPEEKGYEKADPIAKALWVVYKKALMAEQDLTKDQIKKMIAYIDSKAKAPKADSKVVCLQKQLDAGKNPIIAANKCK